MGCELEKTNSHELLRILKASSVAAFTVVKEIECYSNKKCWYSPTPFAPPMTQILDPITFDDNKAVLCCYVNDSSKIQVARITNVSNWYFERVVFPGQRLMFESCVEGQLEIHSGSMASSILEDTIPCARLRVDQVEDEIPDLIVGSALGLAGDVSDAVSARQPVLS